MNHTQDEPVRVRGVERICDIMEHLEEAAEGVTLSSIAACTGLPKSSALRYLAALCRRGWILRHEETGLYRSARPARRSETDDGYWNETPRIRELTRLALAAGGRIDLARLDGRRVVRFGPSVPVGVSCRAAVATTALGRMVLAQLPLEQRDDLVLAERSFNDRRRAEQVWEGFADALGSARRLGFAVDDCETFDEVRCVAVPLPGQGTVAALSVSGPAHVVSRTDVPKLVAHLSRSAAGW